MTDLEERTATGGGCRALAHRPRFPNVMPDVDEFLGRWNAPAAPRRLTRLRRSTDGNINTVGLPGIHEADDVDSGHPPVARRHRGRRPAPGGHAHHGRLAARHI
ncbi:hypothetical protein ACIQVO_09690 [Streptomyces sp. NPDC101062]|uniref:hypothetical protein n=1 Tax=unclassified Streptomyces TaxID=2593676 RepID=UPI0038222330